MVANLTQNATELNTNPFNSAKSVSWIKMATGMFDDEKIRIIESMPEGDAIIVIWLKLLTLAGRTNDQGMIYLAEGIPYTDNQLATILNKPLPVLQLALTTLNHFKMIQITSDGIWIVNWEKHQNVEALERIRENQRKASADYRQRKKESKLLTQGKDASYDASYNVITQNKRKNKKENEIKSTPSNTRQTVEKILLLKENVTSTTLQESAGAANATTWDNKGTIRATTQQIATSAAGGKYE